MEVTVSSGPVMICLASPLSVRPLQCMLLLIHWFKDGTGAFSKESGRQGGLLLNAESLRTSPRKNWLWP